MRHTSLPQLHPKGDDLARLARKHQPARRAGDDSCCGARLQQRGGTGAGSPPLLERRRGEEVDHRLRPARDHARRRGFRAARPAHRHLRQRRHAVGRAADVCPDRLCDRSGEGARRKESRLENKAAVQGRARGRSQGAGGAGRTGISTDHGGDPYRHDRRGVRQDRHRLDCRRAGSALQPALHRSGLSADAGAARLHARQRLQDLHRLRRRHRVHAPPGPRRATAFRPSRWWARRP